MKIRLSQADRSWKLEAGQSAGFQPSAFSLQPPRERGIALIITLIMLAITLVMAVAFLALARRERGSVTTTTDTTTARLAADTAVANAEAQIVAGMFTGASNAYNLRLLVSTNYINPLGFQSNNGNPTNVNYYYANGGLLSAADFAQNAANLFFLPRAPVMISSNEPVGRFYLDLNENGRDDANGMRPVISSDPANPYYDTNGIPIATYNPPDVLSNFFTGDPEWVGVLEHPDAPHGPNNHFVSRYAFIALPVGNSLDINYIHNQALNNGAVTLTTPDYYFRNQGVGSWEINLAAFLADLNTNIWDPVLLPAPLYYSYNEPGGFANQGIAFDDARALIAYRYNKTPLPSANSVLFNAPLTFPYNGMDNYSRGPLQTNLDYNREGPLMPPVDTTLPWSGADSTNHFFTVSDFFDPTKSSPNFVNRLLSTGTSNDTYNAYTYYRMLDELGSDSVPDEGKLNLNYSNAVVTYISRTGLPALPVINVIANAETNLVPWRPQDFFVAAADQMLRLYSSNWFNASYRSFTNTFAVTAPFSITNIPVWVSNRFVYTPAVNRLLQLAANLYDATTNGNNNLPHVFKPLFQKDNTINGDIYIVGYTNVVGVSGPNDAQLAPPYDITQLTGVPRNKPILGNGGAPINVYGVPWIIGAKKGLPNFNQFSLVNAANVTRKLEVTRTTTDPATATYSTNQMYVMGISNTLGISFWNSYSTAYPRALTVYASDVVSMSLTNGANSWSGATNFLLGYPNPYLIIPAGAWQGSQWSGTPPSAVPNQTSFLNFNWSFNFLNPSVYRFGNASFDPIGSLTSSSFETGLKPLPQLPQFGILITNYLQAYILDGNNVIDYVQLRDPWSIWNLNSALADANYPDGTGARLQWSTNYSAVPPTPWGVMNQLIVSSNPNLAPANSWIRPPGMPSSLYSTTPGAAESAFFNGFFEPSFQFQGQNYIVTQTSIQAPYTPSRTAYTSFLLQANDPLVHYLDSDLNSQTGAWAVWANKLKRQNGDYYHSDDPINQPLPVAPANPIGGRYQPWLQNGQMDGLASGTYMPVTNNYSVKDPLAEFPDNWDFPTNPLPSVGWIGRVHRGTPWQTVYLKDADMIKNYTLVGSTPNYVGTNTWANWTGDLLVNNLFINGFNPGFSYAQYYDAANSAPVQDRLLFDIFTTRVNDNAVRGTLPVNQTHLAAWSALFGGMVTLSNSAPVVFPGTALTYTNLFINPAGVNEVISPLWQIVNGPNGINLTRANTNLFPAQSFTHVGDILATPALTGQSPLLHPGPTPAGFGQAQRNYGINDELYEWLPQQMMGLVRLGEPRYVVYGYGQTLKPAPGGEVLGGPFFQLITNYQVVAQSAVRAVIRVDRTNPSQPRAVVESYNVLPPN